MPILLRIFFRCLDHRFGAVNSRPANSQIAGDLVAGGPLTFGHSGRKTEVRPAALPFASRPPLQWFDSPLQSHDFAGQQIFTDEVFVSLASGCLIEIHNGDRNVFPAEQKACLQSALAGNEPPLGCNDHWVQQSHLADAIGQGPQVTQVFPVAEADLYLVDSHKVGGGIWLLAYHFPPLRLSRRWYFLGL